MFEDDFKKHLETLTSDSQSIINKLTDISRENPDKSDVIVKLIEERITKSPPKFKILAFYLIDSILKFVGNPFNSLFEHNLLKIFKSIYSLIPEKRQTLIETFKTWKFSEKNNGLKILNDNLINEIEDFIIKVTGSKSPRLNNVVVENPIVHKPKEIIEVEDHQNDLPHVKLPDDLTPEHFLRECNLLLQDIIRINNSIMGYQDTKFYKTNMKIRNDLIASINLIHDSLLNDSRSNFQFKIQIYHSKFIKIRSILYKQSIKQNLYLQRKYRPNLIPNLNFITTINKPLDLIENDSNLTLWVKEFGLPFKNEKLFKKDMNKPAKINEILHNDKQDILPNFNPLGLDDSIFNDQNDNFPKSRDRAPPVKSIIKRKLDHESNSIKKVRFSS
ncbi:hypothetical protein CLIB1444_01S08548 [[Candida] jaroonii]|uniref:Uncharacterized protein n=1 Tax=[Candida] jaroonii TaxID=467808 RepID=A0ACA9Y0Q4_9ASCO|nr:hypothetical protein CLIB1444_01S08548 [[Candida] jaroonii]